MKQQLHITFILLILLSGLQACKKPGCFDEAGSVTTVERKGASFHQIDLFDHVNLILTQDSVEKITVEAGSNLQPNISTEISNGILTIKNNTTCNWLRDPSEKINVYVSFKNLSLINYNGSGNITATDTLKLQRLGIYSEIGAGNVDLTLDAQQFFSYIYNENADFTIRGKADQCHTYTSSRATIDFSNLVVRYYNMGYGALKDTYIHVTEQIDLEIYYKGHVYYKGNPSIKTTYHSTGRFIKNP